MLKSLLKPKPQAAVIIKKDQTYDIAIIGGGPAGLTAGIYASRARLKTLLVEKALPGGQASTTYNIENYPGFPEGVSGMELTQKMEEQARKCGLEIAWANVTSLKTNKTHHQIITDTKTIKTRTIILSGGCINRPLNVKGEKEFRGRGVSYCATCDGPFYKDKNIMVIGGGNAAVEEAIYLTRYARQVTIVHRRDELRADKIVQEKARENSKIYFLWNSVIEEITGDNQVKEVVVKDVKTEKTSRLPVEGLFIYIGSNPQTEFIKDIIKLDQDNYIMVDDKMQTNIPGIFAAGDIRSKAFKQIVCACADGALAAKNAGEYLEKN